MSVAIPTKLEESLIREVDRLVSQGLYVSRSEAIRDAIRRLVVERYISFSGFLRIMADVMSEVIFDRFRDHITDIILFGSVAGGEASQDSDIDLLLLADVESSTQIGDLEKEVYEVVYPIALSSNTVASIIVISKADFLRWFKDDVHFALEIVQSGIQIKGTTLDELRNI